MVLRVIAHDDRCVAAAQCSATAPTVFGHDDDGVVLVLDETPPADAIAAVRHAERICPASAIEIVEA